MMISEPGPDFAIDQMLANGVVISYAEVARARLMSAADWRQELLALVATGRSMGIVFSLRDERPESAELVRALKIAGCDDELCEAVLANIRQDRLEGAPYVAEDA